MKRRYSKGKNFKKKQQPYFSFSYTQNGLLNMIDRNRRIKEAPQKFQLTNKEFDVIICLEERVYDQVKIEQKTIFLFSNFWTPRNVQHSKRIDYNYKNVVILK